MAKRRGNISFIQRSRSVESGEKAAYHHVTGAGRSRVRRPFFGVNESDESVVADLVDAHLRRVLDRRGGV